MSHGALSATGQALTPAELLDRAQKFALAALELYRHLPARPDAQIPGVQFLRCATAIPANYRAARRARSRAEFIAKLGLVVEECDEAAGWLEFMDKGRVATNEALTTEAKHLSAIFTASLVTARKNLAATQAAARKRETRF